MGENPVDFNLLISNYRLNLTNLNTQKRYWY